jgi:hypothetical protein
MFRLYVYIYSHHQAEYMLYSAWWRLIAIVVFGLWVYIIRYLHVYVIKTGMPCLQRYATQPANTLCLFLYALTETLLHAAESCEKLKGSQVVKKFPRFNGTRRFVTAFTSARHLSLTWDRSIQSMSPHPTSWRSILILSSQIRLGLPSGLSLS